MLVVNISRSRKARPSVVLNEAGAAASGSAVPFEFKPMPPITPPPEHLRRELTPKLGAGVPKQLGSPPEKKSRMQ